MLIEYEFIFGAWPKFTMTNNVGRKNSFWWYIPVKKVSEALFIFCRIEIPGGENISASV